MGQFFERFDRNRLKCRRVALIAVLIVGTCLVGMTGAMAHGISTGAFFQELKPVQTIGSEHNVRRHGYGGFFIFYGGGGRRHFGGGGRIH
jgi:hypothetical protein